MFWNAWSRVLPPPHENINGIRMATFENLSFLEFRQVLVTMLFGLWAIFFHLEIPLLSLYLHHSHLVPICLLAWGIWHWDGTRPPCRQNFPAEETLARVTIRGSFKLHTAVLTGFGTHNSEHLERQTCLLGLFSKSSMRLLFISFLVFLLKPL